MKQILLLFFICGLLFFDLTSAQTARAACSNETDADIMLTRISPVSVAASNSWNANIPANAIDGDCSTLWNSGGFPVQWIEIDFGKSHKLAELRLLPSQSPNGAVIFRVYGGLAPNPASLIYEFSGNPKNNEWTNISLSDPVDNIRYLRVETVQSPSWVGWFEINAYSPNQEPIGYFDGITDNYAWGWTCDVNDYSKPLNVNFYEGPAENNKFLGSAVADVARETAVGNLCGGVNAHGFRWPVPGAFFDGKSHVIYAYANDISSGNRVLLKNQKTLFYAKNTEIYAGIYPSPWADNPPYQKSKEDETLDYINKIPDNFTGVEPHISHGLVKESVDAAHARGFKVMTHCAFLNDCLEMAQIGIDIVAFDEFKVRFETLPQGDPAKGQGLSGQEFNVWKAKLKQANPSTQVGIVESYIKNYLDFYNEGAVPDFIGLERYMNKDGSSNWPYPTYEDFMNKAASKFPNAKIHIWANEIDAVEIYKNKADLLVYFDIDNHILRPENNYPALKLADVENKIAPYCLNRCASIGAKQCVAAGNQICGNYDSDSCLEWGPVAACLAGYSCRNGECESGQPCVAKTCNTLGDHQCGDWSDGCGKTINCGSCASGKICKDGQCVAQSGGGGGGGGGGTIEPQKDSQKLTRAEILTKIAEIKKTLIILIRELIVELQKQLAAMPK